MRKTFALFALCMAAMTAPAQPVFETATQAVANMRIGWNAGNRLDSNSGALDNMWIEAWTEHLPDNYETAWGQPQITRELIHMFKEAGFNAIRVPVTWYPHMGNVIVEPEKTDWKAIWDNTTWTGYDIDPLWMARVKEVVDYVIDEGMYCILNVHHDTGETSTAWLRADMQVYAAQKERFKALWTAIANEFSDYGERLLFEGYNEMLDSYGSWCFASYATSKKYDAAVARSAYDAINSYAQSFVDAVRATGGYNAVRNLVVSTYGACCGEGSWNSHLKDPLKEMLLPADVVADHLIFEVHTYPTPNSQTAARTAVNDVLSAARQHLMSKGAPVIIGEWGIGNTSAQPYFDYMAEYLVRRCKEEGVATFLWMVVADSEDCLVPQWSNTSLKDAIVKGYYGEEGYQGISDITMSADQPVTAIYNMQGVRLNAISAPGCYIINRDGSFTKIHVGAQAF